MAVRRLIKHGLACRITKSSHTLPACITTWAEAEIAAFDGNSAPQNSDSDNSRSAFTVNENLGPENDSSSPAGGSSSSTLSANARRVCLKTSQDYNYRTQKCKRVAFEHNSNLVTCIDTGNKLEVAIRDPKTSVWPRNDGRSLPKTTLVPASGQAAAPAGTEEQVQKNSGEEDCNYTFAPQVVSPALQALFDAQDQEAEENNDLADRVKSALEMHAAASGLLDFALYVTRDAEQLQDLVALAAKYKHITKIASYKRGERMYAVCGQRSPLVPVELYDDCRTSMSGCERFPARY